MENKQLYFNRFTLHKVLHWDWIFQIKNLGFYQLTNEDTQFTSWNYSKRTNEKSNRWWSSWLKLTSWNSEHRNNCEKWGCSVTRKCHKLKYLEKKPADKQVKLQNFSNFLWNLMKVSKYLGKSYHSSTFFHLEFHKFPFFSQTFQRCIWHFKCCFLSCPLNINHYKCGEKNPKKTP